MRCYEARPNILTTYIPVPETGCWLWSGAWDKDGYGKIKGKPTIAHRAFYEAFRGDIPKGALVCHKCDTPCCVNPDHLFLVSRKDNSKDMVRKGRHAANGSKRYPNDVVLAVRDSRDCHRVTASRFGMTIQHVKDIKRGKKRASV